MAVDAPGWGVVTAVVADRTPLLRLGLARSLDLIGVATVAQVEGLCESVEAARTTQATLLVLGGAEHEADRLGLEIGRLESTKVVVLVDDADQPTLATLLAAGPDAVALRTILPEAFGALARRVLAGERSVDPALMSVVIELARTGHRPARPASCATAAATRTAVARPVSARTDGGRPDDGAALTAKEREVLVRLADGRSNAEIAQALFVSPATIKTHLAHIYAKLGVGSRHGAVSRAVALGLLA